MNATIGGGGDRDVEREIKKSIRNLREIVLQFNSLL